MVVSEVMSRYVVRVSYDESAYRAAALMRRSKIGVLPVTRGTTVVGVITDRDIVTRCIAMGRTPLETTVDAIMTQPPVVVEVSTPVDQAMALMAKHQVKRLPVVQKGALAGVVSLSDLLGAVPQQAVAGAYQDIFTPNSGSDSGPSFLGSLFT